MAIPQRETVLHETSCPGDHELLSLMGGDGENDDVRMHVKACASCSLRLTQLAAEVAQLRRVSAHLPPDTPVAPVVTEAESSTIRSELMGTVHSHIGKYRLITLLHVGGQAEVYRAVHPDLSIDVVIKLARTPLPDQPGQRDRLLNEGRILAELQQPGIAKVHDFGLHDNRPYLVMDYLPGRNLAQYRMSQRPDSREAAKLVGRLATIVGQAHRHGIVHQDLSPANVIVGDKGELTVVDFGMARWHEAWQGERSTQKIIGGTADFMAPEQVRCETVKVDSRSDIFALGAILYYLLVGEAPFPGRDACESLGRARNCDFDRQALASANAPRALTKICLRAMAPNPSDRFSSAEELARALEWGLRARHRLVQAFAITATLLIATPVFLWWKPWFARGDASLPPAILLENASVLATPLDTKTAGWTDSNGLEARLDLVVRRGEKVLFLTDAVPLRSGEVLQVSGRLPAKLNLSFFWFDSEGKVHDLSSELQVTRGTESDMFAYGTELAGPAGTELVLLVASHGAPLLSDELERLLGPGSIFAGLPQGSLLMIDRNEVNYSRARGPGKPVNPAEKDVLVQAELLRRALANRFDIILGIGFPHVD